MATRFNRLWAIAAVSALAVACNGNNTKNDSGDAGLVSLHTIVSCTQDVECTPFHCDPVLHHCICLSDADCTSDGGVGYCNNFSGLCVSSIAGCTSDSECSQGQYCNALTRACDSLVGFCQVCNSDESCGQGNSCLTDPNLGENFCGAACMQDTDCATGATCQAIEADGGMQCWPSAGTNCKTFTGCTPDLGTACATDTDCNADGGAGQVCNVMTGLCQAADQVCPAGTICDPSMRVCVTSCTIDAECSEDGSLICENSLCQPPNPCMFDTDCPSNQVCNIPPGASMGICVAFCQQGSNDGGLGTACPTGTVCQAVMESDGTTRFACQNACEQNSDCPLTTVCMDQNGNVFATPNGSLGTCQANYPGSGIQACQVTIACGAVCQWCDSNFSCENATKLTPGICSPCSQDSDCQGPSATNNPNSRCLPLDPTQPSTPTYCGFPCLQQGMEGYGIDGETCPKGFICAALTDTNGDIVGHNCIPATKSCLNGSGTDICQ